MKTSNEFNDIVNELAPTAPDVQFLIVDQCIPNQPPNVHCAVFREYEASYLVGFVYIDQQLKTEHQVQ